MSGPGGDLVFVGDVHLAEGEPAVDEFCRFVEAIAPSTSRLVLAGDLFEVWIGRTEMEGSHHRAVAAALAGLRRRGVLVAYLEGNRDYGIAALHVGTTLDASTDRGLVERHGGKVLFAVHGDLVNEDDRFYRAWRGISRSGAAWAFFHALPAGTRLQLADILRRRLAATNLAYRQRFPEEAVRRFAAGRFREGNDAVVLGHFHVEKDLEAEPPSPPGRILVLPEWKGSRRHLRVGSGGEIAFVDSGF
jgi:UDP-2,3-diacylglucosamine pyrophosphatase LpxH